MQTIPLLQIASQRLTTVLSNQIMAISVYQRRYGLFVDVHRNGEAIVIGAIAENLNRIVRDSYLGFSGDLVFQDTQGTDDPDYTGLGSRFLLWYLTPSEVAARLAA